MKKIEKPKHDFAKTNYCWLNERLKYYMYHYNIGIVTSKISKFSNSNSYYNALNFYRNIPPD